MRRHVNGHERHEECARRDDQEMEDLVEAEDPVPGVRPLERVTQGPEGVDPPPQRSERAPRHPDGGVDRGRDDDGDPADADIQPREHPRGTLIPNSEIAEPTSARIQTATRSEDALPPGKQRHRHRGIGAGDDQEDVAVVQALQDPLHQAGQ